LAVLLVILCVFTFPMYFEERSIYLYALMALKLALLMPLLFDLYHLARGLVEKAIDNSD